MKTVTLKKALGTLALTIGVGTLTAPSAMAYTVYQLEEDYYAIVCTDGQIFSYSGSAGGLSTVGPALCEGHGGIAGGNGGGPQVERAPANVKQMGNRCRQSGRELRGGVSQCPGKVRVQRTAPAAAAPAQPAPATSHNASRSNR